MHNDMGIHMGREFPTENKSNPDGFWEDKDFYDLNIGFVTGDVTYPEFMERVLALIKERQTMDIPWGFKESRMSVLLGCYLPLFDRPKIIWCQRNADLTVASLKKWYGFDDAKAKEFYKSRMLMMERLLRFRNPLIIRFGKERIKKGEIIQAIKEKW
jgi:hypothetical protein